MGFEQNDYIIGSTAATGGIPGMVVGTVEQVGEKLKMGFTGPFNAGLRSDAG
jgi:hypothetical protein